MACAYIIHLSTFDFKKLSKACIAMVIVNVHVFYFFSSIKYLNLLL